MIEWKRRKRNMLYPRRSDHNNGNYIRWFLSLGAHFASQLSDQSHLDITERISPRRHGSFLVADLILTKIYVATNSTPIGCIFM